MLGNERITTDDPLRPLPSQEAQEKSALIVMTYSINTFIHCRPYPNYSAFIGLYLGNGPIVNPIQIKFQRH